MLPNVSWQNYGQVFKGKMSSKKCLNGWLGKIHIGKKLSIQTAENQEKKLDFVLQKCKLSAVASFSHYHRTVYLRVSIELTFWHRSFKFNSNKSPTCCKNFSVYYPDVCLQLNMFRAFLHPSSGAQWLQWQPLVLPWNRGDSRDVFVVGPADRPDHEHTTPVTTIRR